MLSRAGAKKQDLHASRLAAGPPTVASFDRYHSSITECSCSIGRSLPCPPRPRLPLASPAHPPSSQPTFVEIGRVPRRDRFAPAREHQKRLPLPPHALTPASAGKSLPSLSVRMTLESDDVVPRHTIRRIPTLAPPPRPPGAANVILTDIQDGRANRPHAVVPHTDLMPAGARPSPGEPQRSCGHP